jgi:hypothetical protein
MQEMPMSMMSTSVMHRRGKPALLLLYHPRNGVAPWMPLRMTKMTRRNIQHSCTLHTHWSFDCPCQYNGYTVGSSRRQWHKQEGGWWGLLLLLKMHLIVFDKESNSQLTTNDGNQQSMS